MIEFTVLKQSQRSKARIGILQTLHGIVETPCLVPVATHATVKTLSSEEALQTKSQILIANAYHLHLRPGELYVQKHGGLHGFMNWNKPLMTDSGGFQVFSLGFGKDLGIGKIVRRNNRNKIESNGQPQQLKITERGVFFRSPYDGKQFFIGPKESIGIQQKLGADIIFAFDECPPPIADYSYMKRSVERTRRWAQYCLTYKKSKQALFGIVQGGRFKDLRMKSARSIGSMPFDGFGIGGEFGMRKRSMVSMLTMVTTLLPLRKPRHLLGIGHPQDIPLVIQSGVDLFDCIVPTHYGRHGTAFTAIGRLDLTKAVLLNDSRPLDPRCACEVCGHYTRGYIAHLFRAREITGMRLATFHNLFFFNTLIEQYRKLIKQGKF